MSHIKTETPGLSAFALVSTALPIPFYLSDSSELLLPVRQMWIVLPKSVWFCCFCWKSKSICCTYWCKPPGFVIILHVKSITCYVCHVYYVISIWIYNFKPMFWYLDRFVFSTAYIYLYNSMCVVCAHACGAHPHKCAYRYQSTWDSIKHFFSFFFWNKISHQTWNSILARLTGYQAHRTCLSLPQNSGVTNLVLTWMIGIWIQVLSLSQVILPAKLSPPILYK